MEVCVEQLQKFEEKMRSSAENHENVLKQKVKKIKEKLQQEKEVLKKLKSKESQEKLEQLIEKMLKKTKTIQSFLIKSFNLKLFSCNFSHRGAEKARGTEKTRVFR